MISIYDFETNLAKIRKVARALESIHDTKVVLNSDALPNIELNTFYNAPSEWLPIMVIPKEVIAKVLTEQLQNLEQWFLNNGIESPIIIDDLPEDEPDQGDQA